MNQRVIDKVSASADSATGGNDWIILTSPLTASLDHHASTAPESLYVPPANNPSGLALTVTARSQFAPIPTTETTIVSSPLLRPTHRPIVLVGNAGVGKTSWIKHFFKLLQGRERLHTVYYSQKAEAGRPFLNDISKQSKFEKILFRNLVSEIQLICSNVGKTGLKIFDYNLQSIENGSFTSTLEFTNAINEALQIVYANGFLIVLVIDDMDHFNDDLQKFAFETGEWLSQQPGINVITPMRTFTYSVLDIENIYRPTKYFVSAPNLKSFLINRLTYEWDVHSSYSLNELRKLFQRNEISLNSVSAGKIEENLKGLREFHMRIIDTISENQYLENALYSLHNENIDEIAPIVSRMIVSKFFAKTFKKDIILDVPTLKRQEKIVTAYLRGPYEHYRGKSSDYPVADISVISPSNLQPSKIVLPIHLLNYLVNFDGDNHGIDTTAILRLFLGFGYNVGEVNAGLKHLWKLKLIYASSAHSSSNWDGTGIITPSQAGFYVTESFLGEFAFRFFEANADVYDKALPSRKPLNRGKWLVDMAENALAVFEAVCLSWENEVQSIVDSSVDNKDVAIDYISIMDPNNVKYGINWIETCFDEISGRINMLSNSQSITAPDEKAKFRILRQNKMPALKKKISFNIEQYNSIVFERGK